MYNWISTHELMLHLRKIGLLHHSDDCKEPIVDVLAHPDMTIVIAAETDELLATEYRRHFFVIQGRNSQSSDAAAIDMVAMRYIGNDYVNLVVPWLTEHLVSSTIILWPQSKHYLPNGDWLFHEWEQADYRRTISRLRSCGPEIGGLVLSMKNDDDRLILIECAVGTLAGYRDFFVADSAVNIIYRLSHHDKIFAYTSSSAELNMLLRDLASEYPKIVNMSFY